MNPTTASRGAKAVRASSPASAHPHRTTAEPSPPAGWRTFSKTLLAQVAELVAGAAVIDYDSWPIANNLVGMAEDEIGKAVKQISQADATATTFQTTLFRVEALLRGACALEETPVSVRTLLAEPLRLIDVATGDNGVERMPAEDALEEAAPLAQHVDISVTTKTAFCECGEIGANLAQRATWELEALTLELIALADTLRRDEELVCTDHRFFVVKGLATRAKELNGALMSYVGEDDMFSVIDAAVQIDGTSSRVRSEIAGAAS